MKQKLLLSVALVALAACDNADTSSMTDQDLDSASMILAETDQSLSWAGSYLSSRIAQERLDWPRAESFLTTTLGERPSNITLKRRQMLLAIGSGNADQAIKIAREIESVPDPTGLTPLVLLLDPLLVDDFARAESLLDQLPKNALGDFAAPLLRAWFAAGQGKKNMILTNKNGLYAYHRLLLADLTGTVDLVATPALLETAQANLTPLSAERVGDIFLRAGQFPLAAQAYRLVEMMNPALPGIADKIKAARDKTMTGLSSDVAPRLASARQGVALAFFDMASTFYNDRSIESALVFAQISRTLDPSLTEAQLVIGNLLADSGRPDRAIEAYQTIGASSTRYLAVQQKIAALMVDQGQKTQAIETLRGLIALATLSPAQKIDTLMQIGDIYRENEDFKPALAAYNQAIELIDGPPRAEHWDLLYARGMTLERLKRWDEAERDLEAALKFQPEHPYILNYLGYSWADQGINLDQAMKLLLKAVAIVPDDGYITDSVGWVYYRQGKFDEAVKYLERAVELLPYDATVNDHLGDAYWQVGRKREANFQWRRALNYSDEAEQKAAIERKLIEGIPAVTAPENAN
jgi:tetratricopeptide (TPR) repeat protein